MKEIENALELLGTKNESYELQQTNSAALAMTEIQASVAVAKRFLRDEDQSYAKIMKSCKRPAFAEDARYSYPRGGAMILGPSVNLARELARTWGNIRYGLSILRDDEKSRLIRGWAWDLETNTKVEAEDDFQKLIYRKEGGWQIPDERDLRELTNRRGAILIRNCILQLMPKDFIEDAMEACAVTEKDKAAKDPDEAKKKIVLAFGQINITPEMIVQYLGHPVGSCSPAEIATLRGIFKSISDGNSTWADYRKTENAEPESKLKKSAKSKKQQEPKVEPPPAEPPQEHKSNADEFVNKVTMTWNELNPMQKETFLSDCGLETYEEYLGTISNKSDDWSKKIITVLNNYKSM